jgi:hypothetical protein
MNGENRPLITEGPVEIEKHPVEVRDFGKIIDRFGGSCGLYSNSIIGMLLKDLFFSSKKDQIHCFVVL